MEISRITVSDWEHVPAGATVPDGFGNDRTAPKGEGVYTLWELVDESNTHLGWEWEKEA